MKKRLRVCCLVILAVVAHMGAQPAFVRDSLDAFMRRAMTQWKIPGAAIAIVKDGQVVVAKGYGVREHGKPDKVDENTLFGIGSNTKAFTATALAALEANGKLSLDDKVIKWLPEFRLYDTLATCEVMLRDLLCHRIGLGEYQGDFVMWGSSYSRDEIVRKMRLMKPVSSFRSRYAYCNCAFIVAGQVIPRVTGNTWDEYIRDSILVPLGMRRTTTTVAGLEGDPNAARPHMLWNGKPVSIRYGNIDNSAPAGAINSSAAEMAHWLIMQTDSGRYNGRQVIPWKALEETRSAQMVVGEPGVYERLVGGVHFRNYGLGWMLMDYAGRKVVRHTGEVDGFVSLTCFVPEERLGFVLLTNSLGHEFQWPVLYHVLDAYLARPYSDWNDRFYTIFSKAAAEAAAMRAKYMARPANALPPSANLTAYTGTYTHEQYGSVEVKLEEGRIRIYFSAHPGLIATLEHQNGDAFACSFNDKIFGESLVPFTVKDGKVVSFVLTVDPWVDPTEYVFTKLVR